jgi:hypothetical protein
VARPDLAEARALYTWTAWVNVPLLDLVAQYRSIKDEVMPALLAVIERQAFIMGAEVGQLESAVAALSNTRHAVGCASGTDALLLPLKALDLQPGDEVITTPFTFFATAGAVHNAGGTPVFVDIEPTRSTSRRQRSRPRSLPGPGPSSRCISSARWRRSSGCSRWPSATGWP